MALSFLFYVTFAIVVDRKITIAKKTQNELTHLLAAITFAQQFLLFHLHSRDHMGLEGQYPYLLQVSFYLIMALCYGGKTVEYVSLMKEEHYRDEDGLKNFNVESQCQEIIASKKSKFEELGEVK
ncbi:hypothetical protein RYX36_021602 [Vicia faba]